MRIYKLKQAGIDRWEDEKGVVVNEEDILDMLLKNNREIILTSLSGKVDLTMSTMVRMLEEMESILTKEEVLAINSGIEKAHKRLMGNEVKHKEAVNKRKKNGDEYAN